jgi:hypothetical protein
MGRPITMHQANDGSIFATETEMLAHDEVLVGLARIEAFIAARTDWSRGEPARARRILTDFLAFERQPQTPGAGSERP